MIKTIHDTTIFLRKSEREMEENFRLYEFWMNNEKMEVFAKSRYSHKFYYHKNDSENNIKIENLGEWTFKHRKYINKNLTGWTI